MADDITLTVRVRDMTHGDFSRLRNRLNGMKDSLRGVNRATASAGQHSRQLSRDIEGLDRGLNRMQQTGRLTSRQLTEMKNSLTAMSRSALQAARSGEISQDKFRALNSEIGRMRGEFDRLGEGLNNTNNRLRRTNNSVNTTVRSLNGMVTSVTRTTNTLSGSTRHINRTTQSFNNLNGSLGRNGRNSKFASGAFNHLHGKAIGVGVALGATLLPTIGALAPMIAGLGSIVGVAALAFTGLDAPTKFLTKDQKEFLKAIKPVTKEFENLQKTARAAVLPKFTASAVDMRKAVEELNPVIKIAGDSFGDLVGKIARGVSSKEFMGPFTENVKMGTKWVDEFAASFGQFSIKFFEFGTKSQPALDAWQNLLGGFLDTGLPNMFKELEQGIAGSSEFLNALASVINDSLLPGLGRITGSFMKAFGPLLGEMLVAAGNSFATFSEVFERVMAAIAPLISIAADAFRGFNEIMEIGASVAGDLIKSLGGAFIQTLADLAGIDLSNLDGEFRGISNWVKENRGQIRQAFIDIGQSIIGMVQVGVSMLPQLWGAFRLFSELILTSIDAIISGLAIGLGNVPGFGWLKDANTKFDEFARGAREDMDSVGQGISEFVTTANGNLSRARLTFKVDSAKASLADIKKQLQDPELTKERRAKLTADKKVAERELKAAKGELEAFDRYEADATMAADPKKFFGTLAQVNGSKINKKTGILSGNRGPFAAALSWVNSRRIPKKTGNVDANTGAFRRAVAALSGRVLGTSYINVQQRFVASSYDSKAARRFGASGGLASSLPSKRFAGGGSAAGDVLEGPGTKTSDSLIARLSRGEFVMQAKAVDKYGPAFMQSVNEGRLELPGFAKGGPTKAQLKARARAKAKADAQRKSEAEGRSKLADAVQISHFGRMAGYQRAPLAKSIGAAADIGSLTSALNGVRGDIKRAFHGRTESSLLGMLNRGGKNLIFHQKRLADVNKSLEKAKTKLDDLKNSASQLKDSVAQGIIGSSNITKAAGAEDSRVTINTILSQMTASAANSKQFDSMLKQLKARGLDKGLIEEIATAGIEGGGMETAAAVLGGGSAEIKRLNQLRYQILASARSTGATAADAMYGAGIKAADGLVRGLQSRQDQIERHMLKLAKSMEKAIKRALGIRSPSKVMEKIGWFTAEGFDVGIQRHSRRTKAQSWESMLTTGPSSGVARTPVASAAGGRPIVVNLSIAGRDLGEIVIDPIRRAIKHRGGNVQATLGS